MRVDVTPLCYRNRLLISLWFGVTSLLWCVVLLIWNLNWKCDLISSFDILDLYYSQVIEPRTIHYSLHFDTDQYLMKK